MNRKQFNIALFTGDWCINKNFFLIIRRQRTIMFTDLNFITMHNQTNIEGQPIEHLDYFSFGIYLWPGISAQRLKGDVKT